MISVDAVRQNHEDITLNVVNGNLKEVRGLEYENNIMIDDASHKDLSIGKVLTNGIGSEGDASVCLNHNQIKPVIEKRLSERR